MEIIQTVLVYISLFIAVFYLVRVWFWPQTSPATLKKGKRGCDDGACGCS